MTTLSVEQLDAVSEVFNIGVGKAASTLSEMVAREVVLSLPDAKILPRTAIAQQLPPAEVPVSSVFQNFCSPFGDGRAILAFPESKSLGLVKLVAGQQGIDELANLEHEALTEVGNIILNACLACLSDMVGSSIEVSVPEYRSLGDWGEMANGPHVSGDVLMLSIQFDLRDVPVGGRLMFLLEFSKLERLIEAVTQRFMSGMAADG